MSLTQSQIYYLDGLLDGLDDLPDGAWQATCEDRIRMCGEFKGLDPFDVWMEWVDRTSGEQP
jgi:hypothetical protein